MSTDEHLLDDTCRHCHAAPGQQHAAWCLEAVRPSAEQVIREARAIVAAVQEPPIASPLNIQVAGNHYKSLTIQPVEYIHANGIGYFEGNVIKYVTRWREKGGIADLEKAKHYIDLLIELEGRKK